MKSTEMYIQSQSDYYICTPSTQAIKTFFYPICVGHFYYEEGYELHRNSYESFLLLYIIKGKCLFQTNSWKGIASTNQIVLLDCYQAHSYTILEDTETKWVHFDGPVGREYYNRIVESSGNILRLTSNLVLEKWLDKILRSYSENQLTKEATQAQYITNLLTELLTATDGPTKDMQIQDKIGEVTNYIAEHYREPLTLQLLADQVSISPYYFARVFKRETGYSPYEYIIMTRINVAKYLLGTTQMSVKAICYATGFSSESNFCVAFKKVEKCTPSEYREVR